MDEEGFVEVLLHNRRSTAITRGKLLNHSPDFIERLSDLNASTSVRVFTGLDNPNIIIFLLLELLVCLGEL